MVAARAIVAIENPEDIMVISQRPYGRRMGRVGTAVGPLGRGWVVFRGFFLRDGEDENVVTGLRSDDESVGRSYRGLRDIGGRDRERSFILSEFRLFLSLGKYLSVPREPRFV